jgi:AcrR family transcriptional regulator
VNQYDTSTAGAAHTEDTSRARILQAATSLFYSKGYNAASVADILEAAGAAKGTFYHHFASKADVLQEIVQRSIAEAMPQLHEIADAEEMTAPEKLRSLFASSASWKSQNRDVVIGALTAIYSDKNLVLRKRLEDESFRQTIPLYKRIISDGVREGSFRPVDETYTAEFVFSIWLSMSERVAHLFMGAKERPELLEELQDVMTAYQHAMERLLGAEPDSLPIIDTEQLALMRGLHKESDT